MRLGELPWTLRKTREELAKERQKRLWAEAAKKYPPFEVMLRRAIDMEERVLEVIRRSGVVGEHHFAAIRLATMTISQALMPFEAQHRCYEVCPWQECMAPEVRRIAVPLAVGMGKTLVAGATGRLVADLAREDEAPEAGQARGLLYAASSLALLENMLKVLDLMGVPREAVGVYHRTPGAELPSIQADELGAYPVLLVTQQMIQAASGRERDDAPGVKISDLLAFRGSEDRLTIWDESFRSSLADSCNRNHLIDAIGAIQAAHEQGTLYRENTGERSTHDPSFDAAMQALIAVRDRAAEVVQGLRREEAGPLVLPPMSEAVVEHLRWQAWRFYNLSKLPPLGDAVDAIASMAAAGGVDVKVLSGREQGHVVVRPHVVVSDRLERLVVLDAGYMTDVISQMDPTVEPAKFVGLVDGKTIEPKRFSRVTVHCYRGPSGRGGEKSRGRGTSTGLQDDRAREQLIEEQVDRVARVPLTEAALIVTYNRRKGGPDFKAEIEAELGKKVPGWRDTLHGNQRVEVICWGEHVGRNDWRHARHLFFIGVLRRSWAFDLRTEAFAVARGSAAALGEVNPLLVEANQAANALMQAIGRTNARQTVGDEAGAVEVHLPYKESARPFAGMAPCPGSPLYEELKRMMPGCRIVSESLPPKLSGAEHVEKAAERALAELDTEITRITSAKLKPYVMAALPSGMEVSDKVFKQGLKRLEEHALARVRGGERVAWWKKPGARSWIRFDPADADAAAEHPSQTDPAAATDL